MHTDATAAYRRLVQAFMPFRTVVRRPTFDIRRPTSWIARFQPVGVSQAKCSEKGVDKAFRRSLLSRNRYVARVVVGFRLENTR